MSLIQMDSQTLSDQVKRLEDLTLKFDRQVGQISKVQRKRILLEEDFLALRKTSLRTANNVQQILQELTEEPFSDEDVSSQDSEKLNKIVQQLEKDLNLLRDLAKKFRA